MKTPVLIVIIASVVVLCALPALYIYLAYHTYRERQRWKVDHDAALEKMEAEVRLNPRAASAASHSIYSSSAPGRASSSAQHHHQRQTPAPSRPAPAHNPQSAPPRPPRELDVFKSSRDHVSSQADAAPRAASQGGGTSNTRPAPGSRTTTTTTWSSGAGRSRAGFGKKQEQEQEQEQQRRQSSSVHGTTSDEASGGPRPLAFPPASHF